MTNSRILTLSVVLCITASPMALAQHGLEGGTPMTFFVTSESISDGGNLGGLAGGRSGHRAGDSRRALQTTEARGAVTILRFD